MHGEVEYLNLVKRILREGNASDDRTGTGTIRIFGHMSRYSLVDSYNNPILPLLTTKRMFSKGIIAELLWMLRGQTNSKILEEQGVNIWKSNTSRLFLDRVGLEHHPEGEGGRIYGAQWRQWNGEFDQIRWVINEIKNNPSSRRLCVTAWNPTDIPHSVLPPCHCFFQFQVQDGKLSCMLTQRSGDVGLGVPYNIASYSLLTHMVARICNLLPGELIHSIGDAHIYKDHVEPLQTQLRRTPRNFPRFRFAENAPLDVDEEWELEHFLIDDYNPHPRIKMQMST